MKKVVIKKKNVINHSKNGKAFPQAKVSKKRVQVESSKITFSKPTRSKKIAVEKHSDVSKNNNNGDVHKHTHQNTTKTRDVKGKGSGLSFSHYATDQNQNKMGTQSITVNRAGVKKYDMDDADAENGSDESMTMLTYTDKNESSVNSSFTDNKSFPRQKRKTAMSQMMEQLIDSRFQSQTPLTTMDGTVNPKTDRDTRCPKPCEPIYPQRVNDICMPPMFCCTASNRCHCCPHNRSDCLCDYPCLSQRGRHLFERCKTCRAYNYCLSIPGRIQHDREVKRWKNCLKKFPESTSNNLGECREALPKPEELSPMEYCLLQDIHNVGDDLLDPEPPIEPQAQHHRSFVKLVDLTAKQGEPIESDEALIDNKPFETIKAPADAVGEATGKDGDNDVPTDVDDEFNEEYTPPRNYRHSHSLQRKAAAIKPSSKTSSHSSEAIVVDKRKSKKKEKGLSQKASKKSKIAAVDSKETPAKETPSKDEKKKKSKDHDWLSWIWDSLDFSF